MKRFEIEYLGEKVLVEAKVESYQVQDFAKRRLRGLCIKLEEISELDGNEIRLPYATITKSFGEFIGIKNAAYVDLNNCPFAEKFLELRLAQETLLSKESGYCRPPNGQRPRCRICWGIPKSCSFQISYCHLPNFNDFVDSSRTKHLHRLRTNAGEHNHAVNLLHFPEGIDHHRNAGGINKGHL